MCIVLATSALILLSAPFSSWTRRCGRRLSATWLAEVAAAALPLPQLYGVVPEYQEELPVPGHGHRHIGEN